MSTSSSSPSNKPATSRLFGTDGVRGIANQFPMTCEIALALGRAVAHQARRGDHRHRIVIGKDTRLSGYMLEMAFASGVCSMGVDALLVGPMPTPGVAYLTVNMRADAGVVISASHNAYQDNGIKIFARDGFKLPDEKEDELEQLMHDEEVGAVRPTKSSVGKAARIDDAMGRYIVALKSVVPNSLDLEKLTIVIDCAHGAAYKVAPTILRELGATVITKGTAPDGRNINDGCGALHPGPLQQAVLEHRADIGIALDGDADRLIVVDNAGQVVDGDCLLFLAAQRLHRIGALKNQSLVATVMSNLALDHHLQRMGCQVFRSQVGDRYVVETMRQVGACLGGEQSGHLIYLDHSTTGDGLLAALQLLMQLKTEPIPLAQLRQQYQPYPQVLRNVTLSQRATLEQWPHVGQAIAQAQTTLGDKGRVLVRPSGTEPKIRILVEGNDRTQIETIADELSTIIQQAAAKSSS